MKKKGNLILLRKKPFRITANTKLIWCILVEAIHLRTQEANTDWSELTDTRLLQRQTVHGRRRSAGIGGCDWIIQKVTTTCLLARGRRLLAARERLNAKGSHWEDSSISPSNASRANWPQLADIKPQAVGGGVLSKKSHDGRRRGDNRADAPIAIHLLECQSRVPYLRYTPSYARVTDESGKIYSRQLQRGSCKESSCFFIRIKVSLHDTFLHGESSAEVVQNK